MIYGYARLSSLAQPNNDQTIKLLSKGVQNEDIYIDRCSGNTVNRPELNKLIEVLKPRDKLIVTSLDRLGSTVSTRLNILESLLKKDIIITILDLGTIDNTPDGILILNKLSKLS